MLCLTLSTLILSSINSSNISYQKQKQKTQTTQNQKCLPKAQKKNQASNNGRRRSR